MCPKTFFKVESVMKFTTIGSAVLTFALAANLSIVPAVAQEKNPERCLLRRRTHTLFPAIGAISANLKAPTQGRKELFKTYDQTLGEQD